MCHWLIYRQPGNVSDIAVAEGAKLHTLCSLPARASLQGISVGVNGGSAPPGVPRSTPFLWRDVASGAQLIAMWHAGGYSGNPVDDANDCMKVCFASD